MIPDNIKFTYAFTEGPYVIVRMERALDTHLIRSSSRRDLDMPKCAAKVLSLKKIEYITDEYK